MKWLVAVLAVLALRPAFAQDARPSQESVSQLLEIMHTSATLESYLGQLDRAMRASMRQALQGAQLNGEQQQILDDWSTEVVSLMKAELNWESMRPMLIEVYRDTFTQAEVDGMLQFYRSPTGQAVVSKLPLAMQRSMDSMQQRVGKLMPKVAQLETDTLEALRRARERKPAGAPQAPQPSPQPPAPAQPPIVPQATPQ